MAVGSFETLNDTLKPTDFVVRGGFEASAHGMTSTFVLIGNLGGDFWPIFEISGFEGKDALDRWTKAILDPIAKELGARALYPFTEPPLPFLTWAQQVEGLQSSPLGLLIHPDYGLWHAYRAAFLFEEAIEIPSRESLDYPCETCVDKPCLNACPVGAFQVGEYAVTTCRDHVRSRAGETCRLSGCLARKACPVGQVHQYSEKQQQFHMTSFLKR